jgi:hypothetical protein
MKFITEIIYEIISWFSSLFGKTNSLEKEKPGQSNYQLNSRERRDVEEMRKEAPNAILEYYKDGVVWHERTTQGGRTMI